jgi:membrane associated rhomboid family serine protease
MEFTITLVLIIGTSIVSLSAFNNEKIINDLIFYPPSVSRGQWYRFFSCGLIHANYFHLIFNMYALYSFGSNVETGIEYSNTSEKQKGKYYTC